MSVSAKRQEIGQNPTGKARWPWLVLFAIMISLAVAYSLIQPLGESPDEAAHMKYVKFLASEHRLPVWKFDGGGEAGYEAQHPPLYYALGALVYASTSALPENWRWQSVRWLSLLIGACLLLCARGLFLGIFRGRLGPAIAATAAVGFTPLMLEYMSYVNPDILSIFFCCVVLWMSTRVARGEAQTRDRIALAVALGLGLLTKLTIIGVVPVVIAAHFWEPHADHKRRWERRRILLMGTLLGASLMCAWWYSRNSVLYKTPFLHTAGQYGTGLAMALYSGRTLSLLRVTLVNTYFSTWAEGAWLPHNIVGLALFVPITVCIIAAAIGGVVRRIKRSARSLSSDPALWLCGILLISLLVFHQAQVWFVDYEFNAGGRYMLNGLVAASALVIASLGSMRLRRAWLTIWVAGLLVAAIVSPVYMLTVNNRVADPGWHVMKLTIPYR
jgi:4-amino-4-deoxy-L-arabinose transferase-like glycosyltransferase